MHMASCGKSQQCLDVLCCQLQQQALGPVSACAELTKHTQAPGAALLTLTTDGLLVQLYVYAAECMVQEATPPTQLARRQPKVVQGKLWLVLACL